MRFILFMVSAVALIGGEAVSAANAPAPFRFCVLDDAMILQRSKLAVKMAAHFQQIRQQAQVKFTNDSRTLDADERALESLRASLPAAVAKARGEDIARRRTELKSHGEQINRNLATLDDELTASVKKLADPTVRLVEAESGCSVLVATTMLIRVNDASLDITEAVIDKMNAGASPPSAPGR